MATNKFIFQVTTEDLDGNTASETVSVNVGPSECTPPTVEFNFPSGVSVEAGDSIDPYWGAGTSLAAVFCKVFPTARPDEGGTGDFLVQCYSTTAKWPNAPDNRFAQTFESVGGQMAATLTNIATNYMTVTSGTGITGSGLCQSTDLVGLRKAIHITNAASPSTGSLRNIGEDDEGISAYHHDLTDNRVYTLERGNRAMGRPTQEWLIGANVSLHPYHYVPMYANAGAADVLVIPHIMVQEVGTQYPLTGQFTVAGTTVTGSNSDLLTEISGGGTGSYLISGGTNLIKFADAAPWYVISGVLSSSGLVIYNYGDTLALTSQAAQINCFTLGSGTVAIRPDLSGCGSWDVQISPQYEDGGTTPSLNVDYTASIQAVSVGGAISGTPSYDWEVYLSGTTWSGLTPGNLATQTVVYVADIAKRIRVTVSGSGQPACKHQYDTGSISLIEGISAGTWKSIQSTAVGTGGEVESKIRAELVGSRLADKYYHHNLSAMKPMQTKITAITYWSASTIYVTPGTIDRWPNKGTVVIRGPVRQEQQAYMRFTYTGKTNSSLTGTEYETTIEMPTSKPYDQMEFGVTFDTPNASSGSDIWLQQVQPHPFSRVEAVTAPNKVRLRDVGGINNGSSNKWIRFAPGWDDLDYLVGRNGPMIDQPYRITFTNITTREITLDRNLHSSIQEDMFAVMQPYTDQVAGGMYPPSVDTDRLNIWNTACWFVYNPDTGSDRYTTISASSTTSLYIWDPMQNLVKGRSIFEQRWRLPITGRMVIPRGENSSDKGFVIEYNGVTGPLTTPFGSDEINGVQGDRPGIFKLLNVKIVQSLSNSTTSWTFGARTLLVPYQDMEITSLSTVTFEPTDSDIGYNFNGGTSKHLGWSQPLADQVFVTDSVDLTTTDQDQLTIPVLTNYESQHYSEWPQAALRSQPPVFINEPLTDTDDEPGDGGNTGGGCIHYNSVVEIWNGESYDKMPIKDVKIGQLIRTPAGPHEVTNRIESRHGQTRIINVRDGRSVHCTHVHPIATVNDKGKIVWKKAAFVEQGETVMTDSGPQLVDSNIHLSFTGRTIHPFYDLAVAVVAQFFANGILVHNKVTLPGDSPV